MIKSTFLANADSAIAKPPRAMMPFVKWAGGKTQLLPEIQSRLPIKFNRYLEPFLGGGAVFFALAPAEAVLSDSNPELINAYEVVRDEPEQLMKRLSRLQISRETFYSLRATSPATLSPIDRAVRFIYLNKTCFNGLYRVNRLGAFNVPFGSAKNPRLFDADNLIRASEQLDHAELICGDYKDVIARFAKAGDFIYFDPPYLPVSKFSDFKRYTPSFFYEKDHEQLSQLCAALDRRGCAFMISNSSHLKIRGLFSDYRIETVNANRAINCIGSRRGKISELIIRNY